MKTVLAVALFSLVGWGIKRPVIPESVKDEQLVGKDVGAFFQARLEDAACQTSLEEARKTYRDADRVLKSAIAEKQSAVRVDGLEQKMVRARDRYLKVMGRCGRCAARPIEHRSFIEDEVEEEKGIEQHWYIADGSCYVGDLGPEVVKTVFAKAVDRLLDARLYPKSQGGFPAILNFDGIDFQTGQVIAPGKIEGAEYHTFIAVKGPWAGLGNLAYHYFARNEIKHETEGLRSLTIRFRDAKPPAGFNAPTKLFETSASGNRKPTFINTPLPRAQGLWYVAEDGYFRYYTGADFGIRQLTIGDDFATNTLLEALNFIVEQSVGEVAP